MKKRPTLSEHPQLIDDDNWYYEQGKSISVVCWRVIAGVRLPVRVEIPWDMLRESVRRKNAVDRYRKLQRAKKEKS